MHPNSLKNLCQAPRRITPDEPCAKNPVQVRVAESVYTKWMTLPSEVRNQILRETIFQTVQSLDEKNFQST